MIKAEILLDSKNPYNGKRITTWLLTYPRFIHSEFMTHRCFARNAASSRAIPIEKMIGAIQSEPAEFEQYGAANKGMQANELMSEGDINAFKNAWRFAMQEMIYYAKEWKDKTAKQIVNRMLEPWMHMTVIATATEHDNFFSLRAHPDAQPEFQVLAYRMLNNYITSQPIERKWHVPFADSEDLKLLNSIPTKDDYGYLLEFTLKRSVARCARVSYTNHDKDKTYEEDFDLHDRMIKSGHWSPFEHQANATEDMLYYGPFHSWRQYRKHFADKENKVDVDLNNIMNNKPGWVTL